MSNYPKVKILRGIEREGLIKARMRGTVAAKASILTFLDSHIECAPGWLEPLIDRVARNKSNVATPIIDVINEDTFGIWYSASKDTQVGGFSWNLEFKWHLVPQADKQKQNNSAEPVRSPTMAGGLFTIDKSYFQYLGMYDPEFDIW